MLEVYCPECYAQYRLPVSRVGIKFRCKQCGRGVVYTDAARRTITPPTPVAEIAEPLAENEEPLENLLTENEPAVAAMSLTIAAAPVAAHEQKIAETIAEAEIAEDLAISEEIIETPLTTATTIAETALNPAEEIEEPITEIAEPLAANEAAVAAKPATIAAAPVTARKRKTRRRRKIAETVAEASIHAINGEAIAEAEIAEAGAIHEFSTPIAEITEEPIAEIIDEPIAEIIEEPIAEIIDEPIAEIIDDENVASPMAMAAEIVETPEIMVEGDEADGITLTVDENSDEVVIEVGEEFAANDEITETPEIETSDLETPEIVESHESPEITVDDESVAEISEIAEDEITETPEIAASLELMDDFGDNDGLQREGIASAMPPLAADDESAAEISEIAEDEIIETPEIVETHESPEIIDDDEIAASLELMDDFGDDDGLQREGIASAMPPLAVDDGDAAAEISEIAEDEIIETPEIAEIDEINENEIDEIEENIEEVELADDESAAEISEIAEDEITETPEIADFDEIEEDIEEVELADGEVIIADMPEETGETFAELTADEEFTEIANDDELTELVEIPVAPEHNAACTQCAARYNLPDEYRTRNDWQCAICKHPVIFTESPAAAPKLEIIAQTVAPEASEEIAASTPVGINTASLDDLDDDFLNDETFAETEISETAAPEISAAEIIDTVAPEISEATEAVTEVAEEIMAPIEEAEFGEKISEEVAEPLYDMGNTQLGDTITHTTTNVLPTILLDDLKKQQSSDDLVQW